MKNLVLLIFMIIPISTYNQSTYKVEQINMAYQEALNDTAMYQKKVIIRNEIDKVNGTLMQSDTTIIFLNDSNVIYIYHQEYENSYDGPTYIQRKYYLFYIDSKLAFMKKLNILASHGVKTIDVSEDIHAYLNKEGKCLKYYSPREVTSILSTEMDKLEKVTLKEKDCMYCSIQGDEGDKYIMRLIEKEPEYKYLLY